MPFEFKLTGYQRHSEM